MKKIIFAIAIIGVILLTGCSGKSEYTRLSFDDLQLKLGNKDSFVLVIGRESCSACAQYEQTMKSVIKKENVEIFYIDLDTLTKEQSSKIYSKYVVTSTPTTLFIKDGVETSTYNRIVGAADYSKIVESLKKQGFIGE